VTDLDTNAYSVLRQASFWLSPPSLPCLDNPCPLRNQPHCENAHKIEGNSLWLLLFMGSSCSPLVADAGRARRRLVRAESPGQRCPAPLWGVGSESQRSGPVLAPGQNSVCRDRSPQRKSRVDA